MFILKKVGCRLFQTLFRIALPILPYREPKIVPSCSELGNVLLKERSHSVLVVTDAGDVVIHLATSAMGFGGVGESGMGAYHGKDGFDAFSHHKSIVDKKTWLDLPMRYQPYKSRLYEKLLHIFLR